ncbi:GTPase domain-containing protein [Cellulomonas alba]|uniref:GTPase domain-containing protein n=1 Tax=Cellulomonas alba TaxID=3053467 RepID=A0ABT7SKD6_9CELL|nr:GTPase domain-containing protein [Cellulomonas alba]MDM7855992.1 GTPase domain-containing protein [Cellulomonas alba]
MTDSEVAALVDAVTRLRDAVDEVALPFEVASARAARDERRRLLDRLDDHLLPRLRHPDAPTLVVVGGSTGAGKSTLVSALVGAEVSAAGVLRPTTRWPVLVHHPADADQFAGDRVLPGLPRLTGAGAAGGRGLRLVASSVVPPGLALVDAPDIDSVEDENRELAVQLLGAADAWLFVTTAARYADAVPWELLADAARRRTHLALVLDRVDDVEAAPVRAHLTTMLEERGLAGTPVLVVRESRPDDDGLLPAHAVAAVADWATALAVDAPTREAALAATRDGSTLEAAGAARTLADAADEQRTAADRLRAAVLAAYGAARELVAERTSDGSMLRGEVLARWQDVVGTGEWVRAIESGVSRLRDRLTAAVRGRRAAQPALAEAVGHGLEAVVLDAAQDASARAHADWYHDPAGRALLDGLTLSRASGDLRERVDAAVRGWQGDVLELVREEGAGRRATARALSLGVNGLGATLMVAVFASTGGLTGAELGIVGGTVLLAQRLLEAVFGDDAVRRLTRTAHERLDQRVGGVLDAEAARFLALLDPLAAQVHDGGALRSRAALVETAARAAAAAPRDVAERPLVPASGGLRGAGLVGAGLVGAGVAGPGPAVGARPVRTPDERRRWWRLGRRR